VHVWLDELTTHFAFAARSIGVALVLVAWVSVLGSQAQLNSDLLIYVEVGAAVVGIAITQGFTSLPNQHRDKLQVHQASRRQAQEKHRGNGHERQPVQPKGDHYQHGNDAMRP
jgi:hypothetical protein